MFCQYCNKLTKSTISKQQHEIRCKSNPFCLSMDYLKGNSSVNGKMGIDPTPCRFCSKLYNNKIALSNHVTRCADNPDRVIQTFTPAGRERAIAKNKAFRHSAETKKKLSESMKRAVDRNPEAYSSANRGRTKQIVVDGIKLQGQWEVDFYLWAKDQGLNPVRPTESFTYDWNGTRTYFPDFYIESLELYVEVKGYETDRDRAKWLQFPEKLCIIKETEIKKIKNKTFRASSLVSQSSVLIKH